MLKWLHRGLLGVLVAISISSVVVALLNTGIKNRIRFDDGVVQRNPRTISCYRISITGRNLVFAYSELPQGSSRLDDRTTTDFVVCEAITRRVRGPGGTFLAGHGVELRITLPWLAFLSAIYPAMFFYGHYRRRRLNRLSSQPCGQCGYDLQGNESGVCPECGKAIDNTAGVEVTNRC